LNFSYYIAKRYLQKGSHQNAINIISKIASVGIVVGTAALFVVLSVFGGLKSYSLSFVQDFDPDLKVFPKEGKYFTISAEQEKKLASSSYVLSYSKVLEERCIFTFDGKEIIADLKGVDSLFSLVNDVSNILYMGRWVEPNTFQCVPGIGISNKLSMGLYDQRGGLEVMVPKPGKGTISSIQQGFNLEVLAPIGFYSVNEDFDYRHVFVDLTLAQELMNYEPNQISNLEVQLSPNASESDVRKELALIFDDEVLVKNRIQLNESLYRMLNTENVILYLIFTLIIIVTLFTLVGALIMTIIDKKSNLKTLYNLGCTIPQLKRIFLIQGILVCFRGTFLGLMIGVVIVLMQSHFELFMITPSLAYPVDFSIKNILLVIITLSVLGLLASFLASSRLNQKLLS
jgi:lipoprotein-releasing system permease protein